MTWPPPAQDMDGSFTCNTCPPNTFASAAGATQCTQCGDGYEVGARGSNFCNPCPAGTFRDSTVSDTCQPCPAGTSSPEASGKCNQCDPGACHGGRGGGQWLPGIADSPRPPAPAAAAAVTAAGRTGGACEGGDAHTTGLPPTPIFAPLACTPSGTFSATARASSCAECPRGSYQRSHGQKKCELCPAGTYGDSRARSSCKVCPVGTFNPDVGAQASTACQ